MITHELINEGSIEDNMHKFFRRNSCRVDNYHYPLDFVPKLKPKHHGSIPSPMNLGLKSNKSNIKIDKLKLKDTLEYNSDVDIYYNRSKYKLELDKFIRPNQKFKTNKNLIETISEIKEKTIHSKSPPKKVSIRALKVEELNFEDNEIDFLGTKSISYSPKRVSILTHMERRISCAEEYIIQNS
jgi:hypothetical protein